MESITAADLQQHVAYLADEARQGREAGTQGGYDAGNYLAGQLERLRIRAAGPAGGYAKCSGRMSAMCWVGSTAETRN